MTSRHGAFWAGWPAIGTSVWARLGWAISCVTPPWRSSPGGKSAGPMLAASGTGLCVRTLTRNAVAAETTGTWATIFSPTRR